MSCVQAIELKQFPKIKQKKKNWCIFAAVENIVKFHGGSILQDDINQYYIEKYHYIKDIDFNKVYDILTNHFTQDFSYIIINKRNNRSIKRAKDVIELVKKAVHNNIPAILLVDFPSCWYLPGYSTACDHYVFTVLGASQNSILIWDTSPKTINIPVVVENEWVINHLSSDLSSFWIIPNEKLETFENLIK